MWVTTPRPHASTMYTHLYGHACLDTDSHVFQVNIDELVHLGHVHNYDTGIGAA